jgi:hypothetical protein
LKKGTQFEPISFLFSKDLAFFPIRKKLNFESFNKLLTYSKKELARQKICNSCLRYVKVLTNTEKLESLTKTTLSWRVSSFPAKQRNQRNAGTQNQIHVHERILRDYTLDVVPSGSLDPTYTYGVGQ